MMRHALLFVSVLFTPLALAQSSTSSLVEFYKSLCKDKHTEIAKEQCLVEAEEHSETPDCSAGDFWRIRASEDPITDKKSCSVTPMAYSEEDGGLLVIVNEFGVSYSTLGEQYPNSELKIRVDKNQAFVFTESLVGKAATRLSSQLQNGTTVITEYSDWPYDVKRHRKLPVCDLITKIEECKSKIE